MKRLFFLLFPIAAMLMSVGVHAEEQTEQPKAENVLSQYAELPWQGDSLVYESQYGTVSFDPQKDKTAYETRYTVEIPDGAEGFFFCVDIGNYYNLTGGALDAGGAVISFLGADGGLITKASTENASENQYFRRYSLGSDKEYTALPKGAEKIEIKLMGTYRGAGTFRLYFRNFILNFGKTDPMTNTVIFARSDNLATVKVGMNPFVQYVWVAIVVGVAFLLLGIRKFRDKSKVINEIKKGGRR